jgi:hypothetical protein
LRFDDRKGIKVSLGLIVFPVDHLRNVPGGPKSGVDRAGQSGMLTGLFGKVGKRG